MAQVATPLDATLIELAALTTPERLEAMPDETFEHLGDELEAVFELVVAESRRRFG